jgi:FlaA1/EpsC-like NDP-sugar epimerase
MHRHVRWFIIDILVTMTAIAIAGLFWRSTGPLNVGWEAAVVLAFTFAALFSVTNVLLKINLIEWSRAAASDAFDLIPGIAISLCAALAINHILPAQWIGVPFSDAVTPSAFSFWGTRSLLPNGMLIFAGGLAAIGFIVARYRSRLITGLATRWVDWRGVGGRGLERVLIIGGGDSGQFAAWMLQNGKYSLSLHVVGFVDDSLSMQDTRIHGLNVLGRREDIPDLVKELDIGILVFAIHNVTKQERKQLMDICQKTSARIFDFPDIPGEIQQISRSNGSHNGSKTVVHNQPPSEYQHISDPYLTPGYFDSLLAQLEQTVQSGDTSKTLAEIEKIRRKINNENSAIQTAHISTAD